MSWTHDVNDILLVLRGEKVKVGVYECQAGACSPMPLYRRLALGLIEALGEEANPAIEA